MAEVAQNLPSVTGNYLPGSRRRIAGILPPPTPQGVVLCLGHGRVSHGFLAVLPEPADSVTEMGGVRGQRAQVLIQIQWDAGKHAGMMRIPSN